MALQWRVIVWLVGFEEPSGASVPAVGIWDLLVCHAVSTPCFIPFSSLPNVAEGTGDWERSSKYRLETFRGGFVDGIDVINTIMLQRMRRHIYSAALEQTDAFTLCVQTD